MSPTRLLRLKNGSMTIKNKLCWFRTDLRVHDNPALFEATQAGLTIGLFVISPAQWLLHHDAPAKIDLWLRALKELKQTLDRLNIPLKILTVPLWSDVPQALLAFAQANSIDEVHCNREHGLNERRRDRAAYQLLHDNGINLVGHHGTTLLAPGSVKTGSDTYYKVFTPFARACRAKLRQAPVPLYPCPARQQAKNLPDSDAVVDQLEGFTETPVLIQEAWPVDEDSIEARIESFISERIQAYEVNRNYPAIPGTSRISAYLAAGLVSANQCLYAALSANRGESDTGDQGITTWITELLWREFYQHLMFGFPELSMHRPMRPETAAVQWRNSTEDFQRWCAAKTGIPIVDAAIRQLLATGWMHNRLRMIVAMFLTKNLLIDWRWGEAFFMRHLIDGEFAANNGGWQWSASTGADSAPYFRVFNPVSQSEKFDPDGVFIRQWLPELAHLSSKEIHDPGPLVRTSAGYPFAIVDLKSSRVRAIEAFSVLKT